MTKFIIPNFERLEQKVLEQMVLERRLDALPQDKGLKAAIITYWIFSRRRDNNIFSLEEREMALKQLSLTEPLKEYKYYFNGRDRRYGIYLLDLTKLKDRIVNYLQKFSQDMNLLKAAIDAGWEESPYIDGESGCRYPPTFEVKNLLAQIIMTRRTAEKYPDLTDAGHLQYQETSSARLIKQAIIILEMQENKILSSFIDFWRSGGARRIDPVEVQTSDLGPKCANKR